MNKTYSRINWENYPSGNTPINSENLNEMDRSINDIDNRVLQLDEKKATKEEVAPLIRDVQFNESTGTFTITRKNGSLFVIDTKLEKIAINWTYDVSTQQIILTLDDGTKQYIDLSALITQYEFLDTDTINFQVQTDGTVKAIVKDGSITEDKLQPNYLAQIKVESAKAQISEANAANSAKKAESWAHGNTGVRPEESTNNSKYWSEQAKQAYNDFLNAEKVIGVKGNAEAAYRTGNVNITPENIGALSLYGGDIYNDNGDSLSIHANGLQGDDSQILSHFYKVESRTVKANTLYYNEEDTDERYLKAGDDIIGNFTVQSKTQNPIQPLKVRDTRVDILKYNAASTAEKSYSAMSIQKDKISIGNEGTSQTLIQSDTIKIQNGSPMGSLMLHQDSGYYITLKNKEIDFHDVANMDLSQQLKSPGNFGGVYFFNDGHDSTIVTNSGLYFPLNRFSMRQATATDGFYLGLSNITNPMNGTMPNMAVNEESYDSLLKFSRMDTLLSNNGRISIYGKDGVALGFEKGNGKFLESANALTNNTFQVKFRDNKGRYFGMNIPNGYLNDTSIASKLGIFFNGDLFFLNDGNVTNFNNATEQDKQWLLSTSLQNILIDLHKNISTQGNITPENIGALSLNGGMMNIDATIFMKGTDASVDLSAGNSHTQISYNIVTVSGKDSSNQNSRSSINFDKIVVERPSINNDIESIIIKKDSIKIENKKTGVERQYCQLSPSCNYIAYSDYENQIYKDITMDFQNVEFSNEDSKNTTLNKMIFSTALNSNDGLCGMQVNNIYDTEYNDGYMGELYFQSGDVHLKPDQIVYIQFFNDTTKSIRIDPYAIEPKGSLNLGSSGNKWSNIYATNGTIQTSDRTTKTDINNLETQKAQAFINGLTPVSYKMIDGTSGRTHYGFIAQDIEELMNALSMDSKDFAGFIKSPKKITKYEDENGNKLKKPIEEVIEGEYDYSLRYDEFIAPLIKVVQEQQKEIERLKEMIAV